MKRLLTLALAGVLAPSTSEWRSALPGYAGAAWAREHFRELAQQRESYEPFVGWRLAPYAGSTMWGTGADDESTIPSILAREHGVRARNFGETAYTTHQGLETFIRPVQEGHRPDVAGFYDGVNDVAMKCRSDRGIHSIENESWIRERWQIPVGSARYFPYPLVGAIGRGSPSERPRTTDCRSNPAKARQGASALVSDWQIARMVAETHGIRLVAILQPVLYFSRTRSDRLPAALRGNQRKQYEAVYPIVLELMAGTGFHSLVEVLDADEYLYVDFCHLSPNGNRRVARAIAPLLE